MSEAVRVGLTVVGTFALGYIGFRLFKRLRVPSAAVTGSLIVNALATGLGVSWSKYPSLLQFLMQAIIGMMLGSMLSREKAKQITRLILPGILVGVLMLGLALGVGHIIADLTGVDLASALFASVPAGMSEMVSLAIEYELNVPVVSMFQIVRICFVFLWVPFVSRLFSGRSGQGSFVGLRDSVQSPGGTGAKGSGGAEILLTVFIGLTGSGLFKLLHVPGGAIIGGMLFVGAARILDARVPEMPRKYSNIGLIMLGASAGLCFTRSVLYQLKEYLGVVAVFGLLMTLAGLVIALVLHKIFKIDLFTCVLSCTTAGASQMSALAVDMEADAVSVSVIHCIRLMLVIVCTPTIIRLIV